MIDLCTLGTGGTMPLPDRALASLYVRVGGARCWWTAERARKLAYSACRGAYNVLMPFY